MRCELEAYKGTGTGMCDTVLIAKYGLCPNASNHVHSGCRDCDADTHNCKGCGTPVSHDEGRVCTGCQDCEHEMVRSGCADCRGLKDPDPHEGLLIERFGVTARYKTRCACCDQHKIGKGDIIARAVQEDGSGQTDFGWVCGECTDKIAYPEHTG